MNDGRGVGAEARASIGEDPAVEPDLEARTLIRAEVARALAALRQLPDRDREALLLAAGEMGTEEAAGIVGVSRSAFKMRVHRARKRLIGLLAAMGVLVVALTGWLLLVRRPGGPPAAEPSAARYSLTNRNGVVIVRRPGGGAAFLHSGAPADDPPRGMILIVQGDHRP